MIDLLYRITYNCAYQMMRIYSAVCRVQIHGAMVALWYGDAILLVRNSYLRRYTLPGGHVRRDETGRQAAVRELTEEVGVCISEEMLIPALNVADENKRGHIEIFQVDLHNPPVIKVDNREVITAQFFTAAEALKLKLVWPLRQYIEKRQAQS